MNMPGKKIALITKFSWVGISTSVINTALFWEAQGYLVDLYAESPNQQQFSIPNFGKKNIILIETAILARWPLDDLIFCFRKFNNKFDEYEWIIAFDCDALIRVGICRLFKKFNFIYHSLEFYEPRSRRLSSRLRKWLERKFARSSQYIFSQDNARIGYLSHSLGIDTGKFRIIYNSPSGDIINKKENYFREKFGISSDSKIILCVGSLIKEHCVIELVDSVQDWPKNIVLVMHGWFPDKTVKEYVMDKANLLVGRIYLSEDLFSQENKYIPFLSADVGFVGFKSASENTRLAAGSAGKIFDYIRTGMPIVAYESPGMKYLIEGNTLGFVFDDYGSLPDIFAKIFSGYETYRENCFFTNRLFDFDYQYKKVMESL